MKLYTANPKVWTSSTTKIAADLAGQSLEVVVVDANFK